MENEEKNTNFVEIAGEIISLPQKSHEVLGEKFYEFNLKVKRLSGKFDILPITMSERILCDKPLQGDFVKLVGQFRSYNKFEDNRSRLKLSVFAKECQRCDMEVFENQIKLTGYICKEPVYRTTPFNREIADVLLAVNRSFGKSDYIPLIVWGRNARFVKEMHVGDRIAVGGRIQSREYQKKLNEDLVETRTAFEISCQSIVACNENDDNNVLNLIAKYDEEQKVINK